MEKKAWMVVFLLVFVLAPGVGIVLSKKAQAKEKPKSTEVDITCVGKTTFGDCMTWRLYDPKFGVVCYQATGSTPFSCVIASEIP